MIVTKVKRASRERGKEKKDVDGTFPFFVMCEKRSDEQLRDISDECGCGVDVLMGDDY